MKASIHIALDEDHAQQQGGKHGITVWFDDESDKEVLAKTVEALATLREREQEARA